MSNWFRLGIFRILIATLLAALTIGVQSQEPKDDAKKEDEGLPLKPDAKIEFTTDEGTWMSLDVSPDGQTIIFDLLGDLYTLPIGGGEARRIMGAMSFESQPKFSPDGKKIVFISDRSGAENVWIADSDGTNPKAITKGRNLEYVSPSWTPDGQYILVSRTGDGISTHSIWMYHRDGGTGIRIGPPEPPAPEPGSDQPQPQRENKLGAVASPDGKHFYWAKRTGNFSYNVVFPIWQISRFDRETSETSTITNAQGSAMRPLLSPDGKSLVYATRFETATGLRVRDLETGDERWLIYPVTRDDQESRASRDTMPGYAFLPDGQSLVVPIDGRIQRVDVASGRSTPIPFTAHVQAEIAQRLLFENRIDDGPTVHARLIRWPAISPDGKRVVFSSLNHVWIMDLPNGKPQRLASWRSGGQGPPELDKAEFMPTWSPDGRYVAFVTWSSEGGHLFRVAAV